MWTIFYYYYYADNLKVSTVVSIILFFEICSNSWWKLALKLRICVRFAAIFYVERVAGCSYNDLVICKDSSDCLKYE